MLNESGDCSSIKKVRCCGEQECWSTTAHAPGSSSSSTQQQQQQQQRQQDKGTMLRLENQAATEWIRHVSR